MSGKDHPNLLQQIGFGAGMTLPAAMTEWVRADLTSDGATRRHLTRALIPFVPVLAGLLALPVALALRLGLIALVLIVVPYFSLSYLTEHRRRQLSKHGLDPGLVNPRLARTRDAERAAYRARYQPET